MKTSLILGGAVVLTLTALSVTAEARMGAGGAGTSSGMSRMSGGDVRLNTSNTGSPRTFNPDGRTFGSNGIDGGVSAKPLKVKGHNKYKKSEDPENDPPEKEPNPKPTNKGNGGGTTTGSGGNPSGGYYDQPPHHHPHYGGYYGPGPHHGPSYCYYKPC